MIGPSGTIKVLIATKPVDFRKGAEGLASLVKDQMRADPFSGTVFVFRAKRADRIKLIFWDGTGLCLYAKRLEDGQFRWPKVQDGVMRLTAAQLGALLEGIDWRRPDRAQDPNADRGGVNPRLRPSDSRARQGWREIGAPQRAPVVL